MDREELRRQAGRGIGAALCLFCATVPLTIAGANISWGILLAALLAYAAAGGSVPLSARRSAIELPLYAFLAASALASLLGTDPSHSFRFIHQDIHKVWLYLLFMVALSTKPGSAPLAFLALGLAAAGGIGIYQAAPSQIFPTEAWDKVRAHAFVHPVTFGQQMCIAVLGAFSFLVHPPDGLPQRLRQLVAPGFLLLTSSALLLSNTRAALLSCVFGAAAMMLTLPRIRRFAVLALPLAAAMFIGMEYALPNRSLIAHSYNFITSRELPMDHFARLHLWKAAGRIGRDHMVTGIGHNNFRSVLPRYLTTRFEDRRNTWGTAHNLYLHHFAERGLLGLAALLWLLWALWRRSLQRLKERPDAWNLWAFGTITAFLVMNMTEVALQVEIVWMLVFFIWTWAEARHRSA